MNTFRYIGSAQLVIFGSGELRNLRDHLGQFGWQRAFLCTSGTYGRNGTVARVQQLLGHQLGAVFDGVQPHVPDGTVRAARERAEQAEVDVVIGLGGGSAVGTAKAVALDLEARRTGQPSRARTPIDHPLIPVVAIPTTYAGSEMTPTYGVTRQAEGRKVTVTDPKVTPKLVIYDPELTIDLPPALTASTGVNALAHCVEGVYSITRSPVTTVTALRGIEHIHRALPRCVEAGDDREARRDMLVGAYLGGTTIANARMGLHHGICHVLGGSAGLPHGVANSIMLPHVMRYNLSTCTRELAAVARPLSIDAAEMSDYAAGEAAVEAVGDLIRTIGMPQRLRDVGVAEAQLSRLAAIGLESPAVRANPRPITEAAQVEAVLRAAW